MYGFGRGFSRGRGAGFGFRGSSPSWPYVGRGRGGLPRCSYPGVAMAPAPPYVLGAVSYSPETTREQELSFLKEEAEGLKRHLEDIEARIRELELKEK
jgi:hypothetical protein